MRHGAALFALLLAVTAAPSLAEGLACGPESRPFLEMVERTVFRRFGQPPPPPPHPVDRIGTLVCRDGRVLATRVHALPGENVPISVTIVRGRVERWQELLALANEAGIGTVASCDPGPVSLILEQDLRVTWHGRGTRRNTFELSLGDPSLPPCPPEVRALWDALLFLPYPESTDHVIIF